MKTGDTVKLSDAFKEMIRFETLHGRIKCYPLDSLDSFRATALEIATVITVVETPDGEIQIFATKNLVEA